MPLSAETLLERPRRWDEPFGLEMTDADVERLLAIEPFRQMDASRFSETVSLRGILRNDTRVMRYRRGDLIVREGDYGHSAFLILRGSVRASLESLAPELLGRQPRPRGGWWRAIAQIFQRPSVPEARRTAPPRRASVGGGTALRTQDGDERIFLQDVPRVLSANRTARMEPGEFFGEVSALARTPRMATVFAEEDADLLEIRWQGLRDLMRRDDILRTHIHARYREHSLQLHLQETPWLGALPPERLARVADEARFETYGSFEWQAEFNRLGAEPSRRIESEPVIAEEGVPPAGALLIRSGFVRVSRRHGGGHQTIAYLGKGRVFGLAEAVHNLLRPDQAVLPSSLRAVGYVDVIRLPAETLRAHVLPFVPPDALEALLREVKPRPAVPADGILPTPPPPGAPVAREPALKSVSLLEFLVEGRFINGTQTMLIDLDRCTRCDDCVRACAATHDNNPRFIRHGPKHGQFMLANACMHCVDPVCMIGCPTGAIGRDAETGVVTINDRTCIGCTVCANSCPYANIQMVEIRNEQGGRLLDRTTELPILKATKCDLCVDNLGGPACQRACPHDALVRIDVSDVNAVSKWVTR